MNANRLDDLRLAQNHLRELRKLYLKYPELLPEINASMLIKLADAIRMARGDRKRQAS